MTGTGWLAVLCVALAGLLRVELDAGPDRTDAAGTAPAPVLRPAASEVSGRPAPAPVQADGTALLARPLFTPGRRPPAEPAVATPAAAQAPAPQLAGTVVAASVRRSAILVAAPAATTGPDHPVVAHEGDRVGGFTIVRIAPGLVDAVGPAGPVTLRLARSQRSDPAAPPSAPGPWVNPRNRGDTDQDE